MHLCEGLPVGTIYKSLAEIMGDGFGVMDHLQGRVQFCELTTRKRLICKKIPGN